MRSEICGKIVEACEDWGTFQVVDHGVDSSLISEMTRLAREFFALPSEEKLQFDMSGGKKGEGSSKHKQWLDSSTIKSLKAASPTSRKITLRSIREGRLLGVGQCLTSEYRIACHAMQGKVSKDFMEVLVEEHSHVKKVVLNRPKQLNALSFQMVNQLLKLVLACEGDCSVKLIILKGKGRAFSAGGDVAAVVRDIGEGNWTAGAKYFRTEFIMNYVMATYSKPQVSILNGIVMGGGAGASIHGRFRVATEKSVFAMPETALGLFPDVGASYFLPRLPGFFGEYLGLTGTRLDGAEMLACGLATHFVPEARLSLLEEALCNANSSDPDIISAIIDEFSQQPRLKEKSVYHLLDIINNYFSRRTVEEIILALDREAVNTNNSWISSTIKSLKAASPTSLKITLRSIREGRLQGVGQCLISEYRMVCHVVRGKLSKDFMEGCRAILLDKDKNPKWKPSKLELVSDEMVDQYFSKLDDEDWEDLKLPTRSNLPLHVIAKL